MADLGNLRYVVIAPILALILIVSKNVYRISSYSFNIGAALYFGGGLIATVLHGDLRSFTYLPFIVLNIALLPLFGKIRFTTTQIGILAAYFMFTLCFLPGSTPARFIYGNENNYATVAMCASYLALLATKRSLLYQIPVALLFTFFAFASQSRTQLAATILMLTLYFLQRLLGTTFRYITVAILLVIGIAYISLMLGDPLGIIEFVQSVTVGSKAYRGLSYRDVLLFSSLSVLENFPLGVGWGRSGYALEPYTGLQLSPHNQFIKVAVEAGWLAFIGYLVMLFGFVARRATPLSASFLVAVSVRGLFESATPFTLSLISVMLVLPFFLNEQNVDYAGDSLGKTLIRPHLTLHPRGA